MSDEEEIRELKKKLASWQAIARQEGRQYSESIQACNKLEKEIYKLQNEKRIVIVSTED